MDGGHAESPTTHQPRGLARPAVPAERALFPARPPTTTLVTSAPPRPGSSSAARTEVAGNGSSRRAQSGIEGGRLPSDGTAGHREMWSPDPSPGCCDAARARGEPGGGGEASTACLNLRNLTGVACRTRIDGTRGPSAPASAPDEDGPRGRARRPSRQPRRHDAGARAAPLRAAVVGGHRAGTRPRSASRRHPAAPVADYPGSMDRRVRGRVRASGPPQAPGRREHDDSEPPNDAARRPGQAAGGQLR